MRLIIAILIAVGSAGVSAAEVYRWVDSQGKVHYGHKPKHDAEAVDVKPGSGTGEPADAEAAKTAAARAAECETKKKLLSGYRSAPTIKEINGLGEEREYSEDEKQKLIALTEKQVASACGAAPAEGS